MMNNTFSQWFKLFKMKSDNTSCDNNEKNIHCRTTIY